MNEYDVVIIGSGPGGYVAAIRSAQRGLKTAVIEKDHIGGICLNWGCIPTKAIIRSIHVLRDMQQSQEFGIDIAEYNVNMPKIISRSRDVADRLSKGIAFLLKKNKVDLYEGRAELCHGNQVKVMMDNNEVVLLSSKNIIIATGARSKELPHIKLDGKKVISSRHALEMTELPSSMAIMGAGAIGIEFAYIYHNLGVEVTVIEALDTLLPNEDNEISKELHKQFKKQKINVLLSTKVMHVDEDVNGLVLHLEGPKGESDIHVDKLLSAVGVTPNTENIGLESCGIEMERGFIKVSTKQETSVKGIYAIGDVAGNPCLAHKASKEGMIAIDHILGKAVKALNKMHIPGCTYCEPQVASIGLTEQLAESKAIEYTVSKVYYRSIGKAVASGHIDGFMKFIVDAKTNKILGAHCIGSEATELIAELTLALTHEMKIEDIIETIHAHPTLSELVLETAENAIGEAIHV